MSYKFQRLREKLRQAVASGELAGKLPGERALAKRFHVNAKTLSKALTDLAAEGLLDRSIGRGTYVRGCGPADSPQGRWLLLCNPDDTSSPLVQAMREINPELETAGVTSELRPSFLNQFCAVIDLADETSESFLRSLVVRNMPVIAVNREPKTYSMHAVLMDYELALARTAREMLLAGHRRLAAVEPAGAVTVAQALKRAAARYSPEASVDVLSPEEASQLATAAVTGAVCGSVRAACQVRQALSRAGMSVPGEKSLAAVGCLADPAPPCSGYYITPRQVADAVRGLLKDALPTRPVALWLVGQWHDGGTMNCDTISEPASTVQRLPLPVG